MQLESELKVAKKEIGYLQAFMREIDSIGQSDPNVMAIFHKVLKKKKKKK